MVIARDAIWNFSNMKSDRIAPYAAFKRAGRFLSDEVTGLHAGTTKRIGTQRAIPSTRSWTCGLALIPITSAVFPRGMLTVRRGMSSGTPNGSAWGVLRMMTRSPGFTDHLREVLEVPACRLKDISITEALAGQQ